MRLADFIRAEIEPILQEWEEFAKTISSARKMGTTGLRDHAKDMLLAISDDLDSPQSASEQVAKSKGYKPKDVVSPLRLQPRHKSSSQYLSIYDRATRLLFAKDNWNGG